MAVISSNHLKATFIPEDICEMSGNILKENCFTVQHFDYVNERVSGNGGTVIMNQENSMILDFVIRVGSANGGRPLFQQMKENDIFPYSFLFNATFKPTGRLDDYDDAMLAKGFIVEIEEMWNHEAEQMLMHVKLLIDTMTFVGKDNNWELGF